MSDAMVTARMNTIKKRDGAKVLKSLGLTASQAINQLYDYMIDNKNLPFETSEERSHSDSEIREALEFVDSIPEKNCFSTMSDEQIKEARYESLLKS